MNQDELDVILEQHILWLNNSGKRADLSCANLSGVDLSGVDLSGANLIFANLRFTNLSGANLSGANLSGVDLSGVDLSGVDLRYVNFRGANLRGVNLMDTDLRGVNFRGANLSGANLSGANLQETFNLQYSQCSFAGMGEIGRMLTGVVIEGELKFFCGCFSGSESELRDYIEKDADKYKPSRSLALEFVLNTVYLERV